MLQENGDLQLGNVTVHGLTGHLSHGTQNIHFLMLGHGEEAAWYAEEELLNCILGVARPEDDAVMFLKVTRCVVNKVTVA